jgi:hypothetical protein
LKTYLVEVFDKKDSHGLSMPVLQFEATSEKEAHEIVMESLGVYMTMESAS